MSVAEIGLLYGKQRDDLNHHLQNHPNVCGALEAFAQDMDHAAAFFRELRSEIHGHEVQMDGQNYHIEIDGDDDLINHLVEKGLVELRPMDDDDEGDASEITHDWRSCGF